MEVNYVEIRGNVIAKLEEEAGNMSSILSRLSSVVNDIIACRYLEGGTADSYIAEFEDVVSTTFSSINQNITNIADQLESVCKKYEALDQGIEEQLSVR